MKSLLFSAFSVFLILSLGTPPATAGDALDMATGKASPLLDPEPISLAEEDAWRLEMRPYLWTVSMEGTQIVNGIVTPIDVSFSDILDNLDFAFAMTTSIEKGKWSLFLDVNYLKLSVGIDEVPFELFDTVGIGIKSVLAAAVLTYRIAEWDRGFMDFGGGVQYMWLDQQLNFDVNPAGVTALSNRLADQVAGQVADEITRAIARAKPVAIARLEQATKAAVIKGIQSGVIDPDKITPETINFVRAALAQQATAVGSAARKKATKKLEQARRRLAKQIEKEITDAIPDSVGGSESWVDPIIVTRLRHFITEKIYLNLYASIGGFGVSSDLTWAVAFGPGVVINDWLTLEFYYRHFEVDYTNGGFTYDVALDGLFLGMVLKF